jgi:hypothetical protein
MNVNKINNAYHLEIKIFKHHDHGHGCLQIHTHGSRINLRSQIETKIAKCDIGEAQRDPLPPDGHAPTYQI